MSFHAAYKIMWVHEKDTGQINAIKIPVHRRLLLQQWRAQRGGWIRVVWGSVDEASCRLSVQRKDHRDVCSDLRQGFHFTLTTLKTASPGSTECCGQARMGQRRVEGWHRAGKHGRAPTAPSLQSPSCTQTHCPVRSPGLLKISGSCSRPGKLLWVHECMWIHQQL